ncbi:MAG: tetratricopeptide repeat protein [Bryobacteraceae bacterium]|nr:tetratricopeptide repeat protein [Bryobacteraceae bacterium]
MVSEGSQPGRGKSPSKSWRYLQRGHGVTQDYSEAAQWFRRAAEQGDAQAQFNLGVMYYEGQGLRQDYILAHMWWNLAAARDSDDKYAEARDLVATKMTREHIAEAQRLAREWKPKANKSGIAR